MSEKKIVEAVAVASSMTSINGKTSIAKNIERAMSEAVTKAAEKGITDPEEIRNLMLEAREQVKERHKLDTSVGNSGG